MLVSIMLLEVIWVNEDLSINDATLRYLIRIARDLSYSVDAMLVETTRIYSIPTRGHTRHVTWFGLIKIPAANN